jgi:hypothetical protein
VQPIVVTDEFVTETKAVLVLVLLDPKYGAKRAREKYAFDGRKYNDLFSKTIVGGLHHLRAQLALYWTHGTVLMV